MVTEEVVRKTFSPIETNEGSFPSYLADNISWTLTGQDTPMAGHYTTKADLLERVFMSIYARMDGPLKSKITSILISGDWAVVEIKTEGVTKKGNKYVQEFCWICRYEGEIIVEVREYLDGARLKRLLEE